MNTQHTAMSSKKTPVLTDRAFIQTINEPLTKATNNLAQAHDLFNAAKLNATLFILHATDISFADLPSTLHALPGLKAAKIKQQKLLATEKKPNDATDLPVLDYLRDTTKAPALERHIGKNKMNYHWRKLPRVLVELHGGTPGISMLTDPIMYFGASLKQRLATLTNVMAAFTQRMKNVHTYAETLSPLTYDMPIDIDTLQAALNAPDITSIYCQKLVVHKALVMLLMDAQKEQHAQDSHARAPEAIKHPVLLFARNKHDGCGVQNQPTLYVNAFGAAYARNKKTRMIIFHTGQTMEELQSLMKMKFEQIEINTHNVSLCDDFNSVEQLTKTIRSIDDTTEELTLLYLSSHAAETKKKKSGHMLYGVWASENDDTRASTTLRSRGESLVLCFFFAPAVRTYVHVWVSLTIVPSIIPFFL